MGHQVMQVSSAINVFHSDTIDIPQVGTEEVSSTATSTTTDKLVDSTQSFTDSGVKIGSIVYNTTSGTVAIVTAIDSDIQLTLSDDVMTSGDTYTIYKSATKSALLYIGVAGDVEVITDGGNTVIFKSVPVGFHPVFVRRVLSTNTTATDIIACW